jgi:hypothetical protein
VVTVAPEAPLEPVTAAIEKSGLTVDQILEAAAIVIAHGSQAQAAKVRRIAGVTHVEQDVPVDIGPPDAEVS